jgi:tetratricopeptide (TPR) repeat protein
MIEECKELEKKGKEAEKDNLEGAVEAYKQAAECFKNNEKPKDHTSNLEKAAKLLREGAKLQEDPTAAIGIYERSSAIFTQIGKEGAAEKVMQEGYKKFIDSVKKIRSEVKDSEDLESAEQQLQIASEYALKGMDDQLSLDCWIDSGKQYHKKADTIQDPREALEVYKHAIRNYRKGTTQELETTTWTDAANKFNSKASEIYKTNKELVFALDNFIQAGTLYQKANSEEKALSAESKVKEICATMGLPKEYLTDYLDSQKLNPISLL